MPIPSHIQAIVFDAYGTLLNVDSLTVLLGKAFGDKADKINQIWRRKQLEYTWLRTSMGRYVPFSTVTREALSFACEALNISLTPNVLDQISRQYHKLAAYPEVRAVLSSLADSYPLAVLSNADKEMLRSAVEHNGLTPYLSRVLSVEAVEVFKPRAEVYTLATESFAHSPEQIAFVSSNTWDVAGAKAYGFYSIWLRRGGNMDHLQQVPDRSISHISELL